jgi:putative addiction module component (TIGR02574 family)
MENDYNSVLQAAHQLDISERMKLVEDLYGELHEDERLAVQLDEAERRLASYRNGTSKSFPASEVFREASERLRP